MKALDYCALLQMEKSLEVATKLAIHFNYPQLVTRINALRERMFPDNEDDENEFYHHQSEQKVEDDEECTMISESEQQENLPTSGSTTKTSFAGFLHRNKTPTKEIHDDNDNDDKVETDIGSVKKRASKWDDVIST